MIAFISITIIFISNIILVSRVIYSYCFVIVSSFLLIKVPGISNYSVFSYIASSSFSSLKRFLISLIAVSLFSFFNFSFLVADQGLLRYFQIFGSITLDIRDVIFLPYTVCGLKFLGGTTQYDFSLDGYSGLRHIQRLVVIQYFLLCCLSGFMVNFLR